MSLPAVTVIGIGADGWAGLTEPARHRVRTAAVLLGGQRHLALVPHVDGQVRRPWPRPMTDLPDLLADLSDGAEDGVVALASGDPFRSGIGTTLRRLVGDRLTVEPAVSSVALARARMGWSAEEAEVVTLVGRDPDVVRRELAPGRRLLVLSSDETTPRTVADLLDDDGFGASRLTVLGDLGAPHESRTEGTADDLACWGRDLPRLHVLAIEVTGSGRNSWAPGLDDDRFDHDGQLTKRDVRASALARLAPQPGRLLWDVGAGAGSVAIEWLRAHRTCRAVAVESDPGRAARIRDNARRLGVPSLEVVEDRAPAALIDLPTPEAIFVGGGATEPDLLEGCRAALAPGGRLVVHGVTLETEQLLVAAYGAHGGELTRIFVEHAAPIGERFTGWQPARAVTQWAWLKPIVRDEMHPETADPGAFRHGLSRGGGR